MKFEIKSKIPRDGEHKIIPKIPWKIKELHKINGFKETSYQISFVCLLNNFKISNM
jgi:hypothetical protein